MKNIKRSLSVITAVIMVFCMNIFCINTSAASEYIITVKKPESSNVSINGQTFNAYKVFSLTYNGDNYSYTADDTCLSKDYTSVALSVGAVDLDGILAALNTSENSRKFADAVYNEYIKGKNPTVIATATAADEKAVLDVGEAGYFLVFGTGTNPNGQTDKDTVTSLVMLDTTDKTADIEAKLDAPSIIKQIKHNDDNSWGDVGDNQVGDTVEYRFISDVPDRVADFTSYDYIIHDTMTAGLTFDESSVKVYTDENKTDQLDSSYITVTKADDQNFTVKIDVLKAINDSKITSPGKLYTYYEATLNTSALVSEAANTDKHNDNEVYLEYSNNPYDTTSKGETIRDKVYEWTFSFKVSKTDENFNYLENAVFNVKRDGANLKFSSTETENVYVVDPNGSIEDITTDATGIFTIIGLDDEVEYVLSEKTPPSGYSKADDTTFTINSGYNTLGNELTSLSATINGMSGKSNEVDVINKSGSKLVGTGGIGTTIFYVSGGIIMVAAAILLIVKKRMSK